MVIKHGLYAEITTQIGKQQKKKFYEVNAILPG